MQLSHRLVAPVLLLIAGPLCAPAWAQGALAPLSQVRKKLAATGVGTEILFAGGDSGFDGYSRAVDVYDVATETWRTETLSLARGDLAATSAGGLAFFAGGRAGNGGALGSFARVDTVDVYDSATGTWSTTALSLPRNDLAATSAGGKAFFAGGRYDQDPTACTDRVDIYDTATGTWTQAALSRTRFDLAATSVGDLVLFAGGSLSDSTNTAVDLYDTATGTWSTSALSVARGRLSATSVGGKAFFAGGQSPGGNLVDIYDAATGIWSTATLSQARQDLTAVTVGDLAIFAGGRGADVSDVVDIYDSSTGLWSTSTLSVARYYLASASAAGVALFGGGHEGGGPPGITGAVDILDPLLGSVYCTPGIPNSTGSAGTISANGSPLVSDDFVRLFADRLPPGEFGYFLTSRTQGFIAMPGGTQGNLCVVGMVGRYTTRVQAADPAGSLTIPVPLGALPYSPPVAVQPGETWNFQCWYRDLATTNLTDAVSVTFL